jgi:hypothetical protein
MEKIKKDKKNSRNPKKTQNNNIWGLFGGRPHGENK